MIEITIDRKALSIHARGHARGPRNEHGHDLVCAAVSNLMQAYVYAGTRTGHIMEALFDRGDSLARVDPDTTANEELRHIFRGYCLGLQLAAENYPQCLRITDV